MCLLSVILVTEDIANRFAHTVSAYGERFAVLREIMKDNAYKRLRVPYARLKQSCAVIRESARANIDFSDNY